MSVLEIKFLKQELISNMFFFLLSPSLNALREVSNDSDLNVHFGKIQVLRIE